MDGVSWSPPAPRQLTGERPLTAFVHSLPRHLRQPVYKALAKALHPDVGGDLALMQELNNTDHK